MFALVWWVGGCGALRGGIDAVADAAARHAGRKGGGVERTEGGAYALSERGGYGWGGAANERRRGRCVSKRREIVHSGSNSWNPPVLAGGRGGRGRMDVRGPRQAAEYVHRRLRTGSTASVVVASGREMLVRHGLCRVGVRQVVGGWILQACRAGRAIGLVCRARGRARGVRSGAGRPGGWMGGHDVLLR